MLRTASGASLTVDYRPRLERVELVDNDPDDKNAVIILSARNINAGNRQVAHGISAVLRPLDL